MIIRKINSNELMEARNISALCFHWEHDTKELTPEEYFEKEMSNPPTFDSVNWQNTWGTFDENSNMMGCLNIADFMVEFDGASYKMGGVGGVCTYPQYRRQGVIRGIFTKALPELYEQGYAFSYLYAFSEAFYRKFGYEPACHSKGWVFQMDTIPSAAYEGSFQIYRDKRDLKDFEIAYEKFATQYNMCVHRNEYDWKNLTQANPFLGKKSAFLYRDAKGEAAGYFIMNKVEEDGMQILHLSEIVFDSFETLKALLSFAKSFQSDYEAVRFRAPSILELRYFCTDYSQSQSKINLFQNGMARVVNVKKVLEGAKYIGSGQVSLRIIDPIIKENQKNYQVEFAEGKCVQIKDTEFNPKTAVDISMTINQFTNAILGMYDIRDFEYMDFELPYKNEEELKKVFYKKGCWINNFF